MSADAPPWLKVERGDAPLVVSIPHAGTEIPADLEADLLSPWLARRDADWWIDRLYGFATDLGATVVGTTLSRTVIDVNRDPTGISLYPGAATTGLCPTTTFDGEALYRTGRAPDADEIARRTKAYFDPYHGALTTELTRLRAGHPAVVLYDAHSIRSRIPRLFEGELPVFNIGTNSGASCDRALTAMVEDLCDASGWSRVTDGRFKGGYITRHYGTPNLGVRALQMELACRGYMREPSDAPSPLNWPTPFEPALAAPMAHILEGVLRACLRFVSAERPHL